MEIKELNSLEQQALEMITGRLERVLAAQNYTLTQPGKADGNRPALFFGEKSAYAVVYERTTKQFELRQAALDGKKMPDEWTSVSAWMFNPAEHTMKDAESIANDFCQSVEVVSVKKKTVERKAERKKSDEKYVNPAFLMNRFVPVFPDLRYAIQAHREKYGALIPHEMCKQFVVPMVNELLKDANEKQRQERLFEVLSNNYKNGDLDTKSLITLGILNQIEGETSIRRAEELASDELMTAWKCARKYKNRKLKPEKVKKQAVLSAENSTGSLK